MSKTKVFHSETFIKSVCDNVRNNNLITADSFKNHHIKRCLRNQDGTGVIAGVTSVGNVRGYSVIDDERVSIIAAQAYIE